LGASWDWVKARPLGQKFILGLGAFILAVLLSPFLQVASTLLFLVGLVVFVYRAARRRPSRAWGIATAASFAAAIVFALAGDALYGSSVDRAATQRAPQEKAEARPSETTAQSEELEAARRDAEKARTEAERAKEEAEQARKEAEEARAEATHEEGQAEQVAAASPEASEPAAEPRPASPEQRLEARVREAFVMPEDVKRVSIEGPEGCKQVTVEYLTTSATSIEITTQDVYTAIYGNPKLGGAVCSATVNAYGELTDQYGQGSEEQLHSTTIDRATADQINWKEDYMVDFPSVWTLNYMHPSVEAEIAQEEARHALDCAEDRGLFDVDMFCE
jgi:flagellar biosynthesis GTPase FlhF